MKYKDVLNEVMSYELKTPEIVIKPEKDSRTAKKTHFQKEEEHERFNEITLDLYK